jgi:hypothetical protein
MTHHAPPPSAPAIAGMAALSVAVFAVAIWLALTLLG